MIKAALFDLAGVLDSKEPNKELIDFVRDLKKKGVKCYIATTQNLENGSREIKEMGADGLFEEVFSALRIGYLKDQSQFWEAVFRGLPDVKPEEMLFVDDSIVNVEVAKSVGIKAYVYTDFRSFRQEVDPHTN